MQPTIPQTAAAAELERGLTEAAKIIFAPRNWSRCAGCERRYTPDGARHYKELCADCERDTIADQRAIYRAECASQYAGWGDDGSTVYESDEKA